MLEYLTVPPGEDLGPLITTTSHTIPCHSWEYSLTNGELIYRTFPANASMYPQLKYLCPPGALALSSSSEGLLLLTRQGYYYLGIGKWVPTIYASVQQFFQRGEQPTTPMSRRTFQRFQYPRRSWN